MPDNTDSSEARRIAYNLAGTIRDLQLSPQQFYAGATTEEDPLRSGDDLPDENTVAFIQDASDPGVASLAVTLLIDEYGFDGARGFSEDATYVYVLQKGPDFAGWLRRRRFGVR